MSTFDSFTVEKWIYSTLSGDSTLMNLLAIDGKVKNWQTEVYNGVAPSKDAKSKRTPVLPYIVFDRLGTQDEYDRTVCGGILSSFPSYRITLWYATSGSLNPSKVKSIVDRMVTLLDNQKVVLDGLTIKSFRVDTEQPIEVQTDGSVDYGYTAVYGFKTLL